MARPEPSIAVACMDLLVLKSDPSAPVEPVAQPRDPFGPHALYFGAPTCLQNLIDVERHTHVNVFRQERQPCVACIVEPPWLDADFGNEGTVVAQNVDGLVCRSGVGHEDEVSI